MTAFSATLSWSALGEARVVPRLRGISDTPIVEATPQVTFDTDHKTDEYVYTVGGTTYTTGHYYTPAHFPITFTASVQMPQGRSVIEYRWDFGDGTEGYGNPVKHTYKHGNINCQATLRITDDRGQRWYVRKQMYLRSADNVTTPTAIMVTVSETSAVSI